MTQQMYDGVHAAHRRTSVASSRHSRSTASVSADAIGLARQLAGSLQEQLQQATNREARQAEEATARELRIQKEALERERRQFAEARQLQEEAQARELRIAEEARKAQEEIRKAQEAAYNVELERARQTDRR